MTPPANLTNDQNGCRREEKRFQCDICLKVFTRKASMQEHVDRHKGIKDLSQTLKQNDN